MWKDKLCWTDTEYIKYIMTLQAVSPDEFDAWLQTTEVAEDGGAFEPLPIDAPIKQDHPVKKKKASWRRRSSLDDENISSRPCFGVDAETLLANINQEEKAGGDETPSNFVNSYLKRSSDGSSTVVASNQYLQSADDQSEILTFKKRRVTGYTNDSGDCSQFVRKSSTYSQGSSTYSQGSIETEESNPYFRLVTDDSYKLDQEAQFSRHASQYSVPEHTMDQEARFSRRSSQFAVSQGQTAQGVESFLRAMEISERTHKILANHPFARYAEEMKRSQAMKESGESRSLLVRLSRRSAAKSLTGGMNSTDGAKSKLNSIGCSYNPTSNSIKSNLDRVAADLRRMEAMLVAEQEQQLGIIRSEFR